MIGFCARVPYRQVRAGLQRTVLSILAVALGVALVVAIELMNSAVLASFLDTLDGVSGRTALTILAGGDLTVPETLVDDVAGIPGVELAVPLVVGDAFPDDGTGELLRVHGVDLTHDAAVRLYRSAGDADAIDDVLAFLNQPDSILVGSEFAASRGWKKDDPISLVTPRGVRRFTIRGLLDADGLAKVLRGRLVVMDLYAAERVFTADGRVNEVDVVLGPGADAAAVKRAIEAKAPPGATVEEPVLRKDIIRRTVRGFQAMLASFGILAVLAGFVICFSRLSALFEARTWQIGLMRAVGARRSTIMLLLLSESLLLGAAGTAVGVPLGIAIARVGLPFAAAATALNFHMPLGSPHTLVTAGTIALGAAVGLGAAVLAAAVPAARLARTQPVAALTLRGRDAPMPAGQRPWMRGAVVVIATILVAVQAQVRIPALGHLTTAAIALAACALARTLVDQGGQHLALVLAAMFGPVGRFATTHIRQQARRASLTVGTFGLGLGVVVMFGILGWSFEKTLVSQVASRLKADLVITSAFVSGGWVSAPLDDVVLGEMRAIPQIAAVAGEQRRDVTYHGRAAVLDAYDPPCFEDAHVCRWPFAGAALPNAVDLVARGEAAIVSTAFAYQQHVRTGDTLTLDSPPGAQRLLVAGITPSEPTAAIIMSRDRYRRAWNDDLVTWIHASISRDVARGDAEAAIRMRLGERYRLQIRSGSELIEYFAAQARRAFSLLYVMEGIIFVLVLIGVGDTLASGVAERTREFATMRAVGLNRRHVFAAVMLEGVVVGLLGLVLATVTGLALGAFWVAVQFPAILGWQLTLHVPTAFIVGAAILTLLLCVVGSTTPSLRAAYLRVGYALRDE